MWMKSAKKQKNKNVVSLVIQIGGLRQKERKNECIFTTTKSMKDNLKLHSFICVCMYARMHYVFITTTNESA